MRGQAPSTIALAAPRAHDRDAGGCVGRSPVERRTPMTRAEFETELRREGYEIREGEFKPDHHKAAHAHDFDARVLVLDGSVTMVFGKDQVTFGPGDACTVPAGTMHEEHTG